MWPLRTAAAAQDDRLTVPAHVGNQLHAIGRAHQRAAFALLGQGMVLTDLRHGELMPDVTRTGLKDELLFVSEQVGVEVAGYG